ncbi:MAG: serine/threonine protein kinase [Phycisphaerales bacterium]|nr:serine/threonine protein kinase [Phycisphaerales bacterium]
MTIDHSHNLWKTNDPAPTAPKPPLLPGLRVIRLLGAGGFGAVWLCEQSEPLQRQVAVKVMRTVIAGPRLRHRFEAERRLLARMDHPGIAHVFDAGEATDGSLYFVMELVTGEPLLDWCDGNRLSIEARLALARQVCAAVQHAHTKGIIHLDLKSANILVREVDGLPVVKVIDFGVAQLADDPDALQTLAGEALGPVGTLEYMAPEQLKGTRQLDTRADIYSLGVTIYQLLCGLQPFDSRELRAAGTIEAQRLIRELEPDAPSERFQQLMAVESAQATQHSAVRQLDSRKLLQKIRGELDAVVLRCLEKDPRNRYGTCDALSDDLARWLAFEPVIAQPASTALRLRKFARRHRVGIAAAAMICLAIAGGVIAMTYGLLEARRQLARAERLHEFNNDMLGAVTPDIAKGMDTRLVRMIFDKSMGSIETRFADDPELAADAHRTAGAAYRALGDYPVALKHFEARSNLLGKLYEADDLELLSAHNDLGNALMLVNRTDEAAPLLEHVFARRRALLGENDLRTLKSLHNIAWLREEQDRPQEALALYTDVVARKRIVLGADDDSTLQSLNFLGELQRRLGDFPAARATFEDVIARRTALVGKDSTDTLIARNNYLVVLKALGEAKVSEPQLRELIEDMTRILGADHYLTLIAQNNRAAILRDSDRLAEAEVIYRSNLSRFEAKYGSQHTYTLVTLANLALALERQRKFEEAEPLLVSVVVRMRKSLGDKSLSTLTSITTLVGYYLDRERFTEAQTLSNEASAALRETVGARHPMTIRSDIQGAQAERRLGSLANALELINEALGSDHPKVPVDLELIVKQVQGEALLAQGDRAGAVKSLEIAHEIAVSIKKETAAREIALMLAQARGATE